MIGWECCQVLDLEKELKKAAGENKMYFTGPHSHWVPQIDGLSDNQELLSTVHNNEHAEGSQIQNTSGDSEKSEKQETLQEQQQEALNDSQETSRVTNPEDLETDEEKSQYEDGSLVQDVPMETDDDTYGRWQTQGGYLDQMMGGRSHLSYLRVLFSPKHDVVIGVLNT